MTRCFIVDCDTRLGDVRRRVFAPNAHEAAKFCAAVVPEFVQVIEMARVLKTAADWSEE